MIEEFRYVWYFKGNDLHADRNSCIDWRTFGFELIDERYLRQVFVRSAKEFLRAVVRNFDSHYDCASPLSIANFSRLLRRLIRWMIDCRIYRFCELNQHHLITFVLERGQNSRELPTRRTTRTYINLFERLWDLRREYHASLVVNPYRISEFFHFLERTSTGKVWAPIEESAAVSLLNDARCWLENEGPLLLKVLDQHSNSRGLLRGLTKSEMRRRSKIAYSSLVINSSEYRQLCSMLGLDHQRVLPQEVLRIGNRTALAASALTILLLTGVRCSELLSLELDCCTYIEHSDGKFFWYISGIAAKQGGRRKQWIVPQPVVDAIRFLEKWHVAVLSEAENSFLFAVPNGNSILPPPYVSVRRFWPSTVADLLREFAYSQLRSQPLAAPQRIHPHQARKTFARFVVRRDKRGLDALAPHYGHLYTAILDGIYVGNDIALAQLIEEESEREVISGLTDILNAKNLGGKAGEKIAAFRQKHRQRFRGKLGLKVVVEQLMREGVILAPCDWGYCVYSKDSSACGGDDRKPNAVQREPNLCSTCSNFAVTEKHRTWWEERATREESFLRQENVGEQSRAISRLRLDHTSAVLAKLNGKKYT